MAPRRGYRHTESGPRQRTAAGTIRDEGRGKRNVPTTKKQTILARIRESHGGRLAGPGLTGSVPVEA